MAALGDELITASLTIQTAPIGPSRRRFANAAAIISTRKNPDELIAHLKAIEVRFGRRRGRQWGPRVLDLDIILWSGGMWASQELTIPHPAFRSRAFVLGPLAAIAPQWRDPVSNLAVRQLKARLDRRRPQP